MLCDYDPEFDYSVPYFWGSVGLVYDAEKIDQKDVEPKVMKLGIIILTKELVLKKEIIGLNLKD